MGRPCIQRFIGQLPGTTTFKPQGIPVGRLEHCTLSLDEFEAIRLADIDGDTQEEAAAKMNVSRATFARILERAHATIAGALVHGKALHIAGGPVREARRSHVRCRRCQRGWEVPDPVLRAFRCPSCTSGGDEPARGGAPHQKGEEHHHGQQHQTNRLRHR